MKMFIPMADGQSISKEVILSLGKQTEPIDIVPACTEGVVKSNREVISSRDIIRKHVCEWNSRRKIFKLISDSSFIDSYFGMCDSDIIFLHEDSIAKAIQFLEDNKDYVGVALLPLGSGISNGHIRMCVGVYRTSMMKNVEFEIDYETFGCKCDQYKDRLIKIGKWDYLPCEKGLVREIISVINI